MTDDPKSADPKPSNEGFEFPSLHDEPSQHTEPSSKPQPESELKPDPSDEKPKLNLKDKLPPQAILWARKNKTLSIILGFFAVGLLMWGFYELRHRTPDDTPTHNPTDVDEIPVNVIEARFGPFEDVISSPGTIKGEAEIELRFETEGTIQEFRPTEGAKIRKGDLIARLNDRDARLKVERANIELQQNIKLYELGGISKTKRDEAQYNLDIAQAELEKTRIVASREGILGEKSAEVGEYVNPQRKVGSLVAIKNVLVKIGIIEKQVDKVYPGLKITVSVDAYPGNVFEGTIETISPIIDTGGSRTFEVSAKLPNPDSLLLPGMFARARIIIYRAEDAISVPNDALVKAPGGYQVYVVNKDNIAEARDIELGQSSTELTQVKSGLSAGDIIVVQKPPELKAGSKVKVVEVQK